MNHSETRPSKTVLVVEDDAAIRRGIVDALRFHGYATVEAGDGDEGSRCAVSAAYDLLLLDLMLPGASGLEILRQVRGSRPTVPVIILTARGSEEDRVSGLRSGADDYVVKPFSVKELLARVEAVLRRSPERPLDVTSVAIEGVGTADFDRRCVLLRDGTRRDLSEREVELLRYLARQGGRTVSREELLRRVWGVDPTRTSTRTIDMHVARLREKLGGEAAARILVTVRGKGYRLESASLPPGEEPT